MSYLTKGSFWGASGARDGEPPLAGEHIKE